MVLDRLVPVVPLDGEQEPTQGHVVDAEPRQEPEVDEHPDRGLDCFPELNLTGFGEKKSVANFFSELLTLN